MQDIVNLIGNVGFPIVMAIYMMNEMSKMNKNHMEEIEKLNAVHKNEVDGLKCTLENNTNAILKLSEEIGRRNFEN